MAVRGLRKRGVGMCKSVRHVTKPRRSGGRWANRRAGAKRATSLHETQAAAARAAGVYLLKAGGGDLFIHRPNGRIRARRTIPAA